MNEYPLAHVARIFDEKSENLETDDIRLTVPSELLTNYFKQFTWLIYEYGKLQCKICQNAYKKYSQQLERDEWTCPADFSPVLFNRDNLILILKIHNFSENHIRSETILKAEIEKRNSSVSRSIGTKPGSLKWERYLSKFPWMYIKEHNPGCTICERAVQISKKLPFTKWSDPNLQEPMRTDRPTKMLMQHHLSKYHKTAEEIVNSSIILGEVSPNNPNDDVLVLEPLLDSDKPDKWEPKAAVSNQEWGKLILKYRWLCGDNGQFYGCKLCQKARKIDPCKIAPNNWTEDMIPFTDKVWYTYLSKKCYSHSVTQSHITAVSVVDNYHSPDLLLSDGFSLHSSTLFNNSAVVSIDNDSVKDNVFI